MKAKISKDGKLHIVGYVNVPGRESRPVNTPRGKVIEVVEQRAFERAIQKSGKISMLLDHNPEKCLCTTDDNLRLVEDEVGLRAEAIVSDPEAIEGAKKGKIKGWSFKMRKVIDDVEERAGKLPLRTIKDFVMPEVSLIMNQNPYYSSTSVEYRADDDEGEQTEVRASESNFDVSVETPEETYDNSDFRTRANNLG